MHGRHTCGRRSKGRFGAARCTITRLRLAPGSTSAAYAPACARHLTLDERRRLGLLPGLVPAPRRPCLDVAKLRAGDRD